MRPAYLLPNGKTVHEITIWKAIVFGILTLGIYVLVVQYGTTRDIQGARKEPFELWQVFFWVGILIGLLHVINWVFNGIGLTEWRRAGGLQESSLWIVALVLAVLVYPVGAIIWAVHYNETIRAVGKPAGRP